MVGTLPPLHVSNPCSSSLHLTFSVSSSLLDLSLPLSFSVDRYEISETALLRDVVLAFQGITGRHVLYDANLDGYAISPQLGVPPPTRSLVCKLTELGWLFTQLRQYCITCQSDLTYGLTGQVRAQTRGQM